MEHHKVESSNIESVAHDPDKSLLQVKFLNGTTYNYDGVPKAKFDDLLTAKSVGQHLAKHIKGHHPHSKVDEQ